MLNIDQLISSGSGMDEKWESRSTNLFNAAAQPIGFKIKKHKDWFDENNSAIPALLNKMYRAHRATLNNPLSQLLRRQWQDLWSEAQATLRNLQNEWWISKANEIHAERNAMYNFCDAVKTAYGPRNCSLVPVRSADGKTLIKDQALIVEWWAKHFNTLLNQPTQVDPTVLEELPEQPTFQT